MPHEMFAATQSLRTMIGSGARVLAKAKPRVSGHRRQERSELVFLLGVLALVAVVTAVARSGWYAAESDFAYWLGFAGGVGMLLLFLYPLRKHWRPARDMGTTRFWFALHMMLGITGPLLIVLHSTLSFGSVNATVAFASMVLVACSGIIGRFLYRRIHHGLYGRRATLAEVRSRLGLDSKLVRSKLAFAPRVEEWMAAFEQQAEASIGDRGFGRPLRFLLLGFEAARVRRACVAEMNRKLKRRALDEAWSKQKLVRRAQARNVLITHYIRAVQQVAQFGAYERLFSWWHLLHVPLIYMLVFSAIAHVVAVHMY